MRVTSRVAIFYQRAGGCYGRPDTTRGGCGSNCDLRLQRQDKPHNSGWVRIERTRMSIAMSQFERTAFGRQSFLRRSLGVGVALLLLAPDLSAQDVRITGVVDGPLTGGVPKAVELYVATAVDDLSVFGLGSANNGGGSDGQEFALAGSAEAGDYLYVASEAEGFREYFGFTPDFVASAVNINGDDAIELFQTGVVVDVFGEVDADGTGTAWDYVDGWAYRVNDTGPDGSAFALPSFRFSGANALDGTATNDAAALPFPIGSFKHGAGAAPAVVRTEPSQGAESVVGDVTIWLEFSEPVTFAGAAFELDCELVGVLAVEVTQDAQRVALSPAMELPAGAQCSLAVRAASVVGSSGIPMRRDFFLDFETEMEAGCFGDATPIYELQGAGSESPFVGQTVTLEGIVTGDFQGGEGADGDLRGYFVQEEAGDGSGDTSDGIFVFEPRNTGDVATGDRVRVKGLVGEYFGETQVTASAVEKCGVGSVQPVEIHLPVAAGYRNDDGRWIADLERYEGMLVRLPQQLTVSELFNLDRFGEMRLSVGGRPEQFTSFHPPDPRQYPEHIERIARGSVLLDDGLRVQNPSPIRFPAPGLLTSNAVRMGDTLTGLVGNLRFSRGSGGSGDENYRVMPTVEPLFEAGNPRPEPLVASGEGLRVAGLNVLNFFTTVDQPGASCFPSGDRSQCRGADSDAEYQRQLAKLLTTLIGLNADVYALVELENSAERGPAKSLEVLARALETSGAPCSSYGYSDTGAPIGGDAIALGLLYCQDRVVLAPGSTFATLSDDDFASLGFEPGDAVFDGNATSRSPLAATFLELATGEEFTVVVNHFKSKGQSGLACPEPEADPNCDKLDGQGYWNARRLLAAEAVQRWLATHPTGSADPDVLVLGDLNAYLEEDPVRHLESAGYENLLRRLDAPYSYVFDGQLGVLDHALASPSLAAQVALVSEWHVNADEADALDYNLDFGRSAHIFDASVPYRSADHDPVVVDLKLRLRPIAFCDCDAPGAIRGTERSDVLLGTHGADIICAFGGHDIVLGLGGDDCIDLGDGFDLALGGDGADRVYGGEGDDVILGGRGRDTLVGGRGSNLLIGGAGRDVCEAADRRLSCEE